MATGGGLGRKVMGSKAGKGTAAFFGGGGAGKKAFTKARQGGASKADALKAGKGARMGSKIMRGGGALAVGMGGFDIYNTLSNDKLNKHEKSSGVGQTVGEIGGATAGGKIGGMIGTALAPVTGGLSIPIGVLLGAIGGGLVGGKVGKDVGGSMSPKQRRLDMQESTAQAAFFGGEFSGKRNREAEEWRDAGSGEEFRRFKIGEEGLPEDVTGPILKKMGADIMANMGNVPFEALQGVVEEASSGISGAAAERKELKDKKGFWGGAYSKNVKERQDKIAKAEAKILEENDRLANARALMAGWNFKAHEDQVAWEGRMKPVREKLLAATQLYTKTTYDLVQAQTKRITAATHQETAAKDEAFLVNALGKGPKGEAAKTMASINVGEASLEVFRQKKDIAAQTAAEAPAKAAHDTRDMITDFKGKSFKDLMPDIEKRQLAMEQMIDPKVAMADTTKKAFESAALRFGVSLKKTEADIAAKKIETQKKIEDLQLQTVNAMVSHVKTIYDEGGMDATMLEAQGTAMSGLAQQAATGDLDEAGLQRLGLMIADYDPSGSGFSAAELATFFGTSLEQWEIAMKKVTAAGMTGAEADKQRLRDRERTIINAKGEKEQQKFEAGVAQKKGFNTEEDMNKLKDQEDALGAAMVAVTEKWENFAKKGDTKDIAEKIEKMEKAINEGEGTAEDINEQLKGVLKASESQATFIAEQAKFAATAIKLIRAQTARLEALEGEEKRIKGQGDVTPAAEFLTGS